MCLSKSAYVETPNTLIAYHQPSIPEYRFFRARGYYDKDTPTSEKLETIIDFIKADDPLAEDRFSIPFK